jgi:hypothetical protein
VPASFVPVGHVAGIVDEKSGRENGLAFTVDESNCQMARSTIKSQHVMKDK